MHILYLTYDGLTDNLGQSQIIPYLTGLSELNHKITIISFEKDFNYNKVGDVAKKHLFLKNIEWIPLRYTKTPPVLSTLYDILKLKKAVKKRLKNNSCDIIHCRSYITSIIGLWVKKKYACLPDRQRIKFVFDMRGFWADERIDGGIWNLKSFVHKRIYTFFKKKEIEFLSNADYTVSLTQNAKDEIFSWEPFRNKQIPIKVIPCCTDLKHFSAENISDSQKTIARNELDLLKTSFVLSYVGSLGTWYLLDEMLDFFNYLTYEHSDAKFLFITHENSKMIFEAAKKRNLDKSRIIVKSASRDEVPLYLSLSNLSVFFIKPAFSKIASSPTKMGELLALGIPVITNSGIGDCDKILSDSGAGVVIDQFNDTAFAQAMVKMESLFSIDKSKIIAAAVNYFSLSDGIQKYDTIYQEFLSE